MDKRVGVVGLGIMGGAFARNMAERGWTEIGFDLDATARANAKSAGVTVVESVGEVARQAPMVITSLPSPKAAAAVAQEIADSGTKGVIVAETSTLGLADKQIFANILSEAGHIPLDCPVSGTGAQAAVRDLLVFASGDSAAIARFMPAFADMGKQSFDLGPFGNGSKMKFVANVLVIIHNAAAAEALLLAEFAGLDLQQVVDVVSPGAGGSRMLQVRGPLMAKRTYVPPTARVSVQLKDQSIISGFAKELGCPIPFFDLAASMYERAPAMGLSDWDTACVFEVMERLARGKDGAEVKAAS